MRNQYFSRIILAFLLGIGLIAASVAIFSYLAKPNLPPLGLDYFFYFLFTIGIGGLIRGVIELYVLGGWANTPRKFSAYTEVVNRTSHSLILLGGTVFILWLT